MTSTSKHKSKLRKGLTIIGWVILGILGMAAFALVFGYVVMLLWNWLMPGIFGLVAIGFWQAVGIVILAKLLFGGFGSHRPRNRSEKVRGRFRERCSEKGISKWKHYDAFWQEEGKEAFRSYMERMQGKPQ
jgi:hypothetical protein